MILLTLTWKLFQDPLGRQLYCRPAAGTRGWQYNCHPNGSIFLHLVILLTRTYSSGHPCADQRHEAARRKVHYVELPRLFTDYLKRLGLASAQRNHDAPPSASCANSGGGHSTAMAVTMMRSYGARSGQPSVPSPVSSVTFA